MAGATRSMSLLVDDAADCANHEAKCVNTLKRKRSLASGQETPQANRNPLVRLADRICDELSISPPEDPIHKCGRAAISILATDPGRALELAKDKINTWEYRKMPHCWLRLYEDSSLFRVVSLLRSSTSQCDDLLGRIIELLDHVLIIAGGFGRSELCTSVFQELELSLGDASSGAEFPTSLTIIRPRALVTSHTIPDIEAPSLAAFQTHLESKTVPLLMHGVFDHWPAMKTWHKTSHLLKHTLGGRRLVPIEIGDTYLHGQWRQKLMPLCEYTRNYLLPENPEDIGYMGQHDLFSQIPSLRNEITIPDYCYSTPPEAVPESVVGLLPTPELPEPQLNAWLGPRGTRSPLHHDPYHNIFCQVVGYKYIRLYPPSATSSMYRKDVDEKGISLSNTSSVDIRFDPEQPENIYVEDAARHPLFCDQKDYQEAIVGPGGSLYIPAGWWHYIEALSASFSVSFWWN